MRDDETESYNMAIYLNNCLTPIFLSAIILEIASFFLYTNLVKSQKLFKIYFLKLVIRNYSILDLNLAIKKSINVCLNVLDASMETNNQRRGQRGGDHEMLHVSREYTLL